MSGYRRGHDVRGRRGEPAASAVCVHGRASAEGGVGMSRLESLTNEGDSRSSIAFRLSVLCHFTFLSYLFCQVDQCGQRL